jgi:mannose-6-phosphate isomerase
MLYPFVFHPIFKERIWGGRNIGTLFCKELPPGCPIGESWEISDRPGDVSVIANGPLAGKDLHWLMEHEKADLLGSATASGDRFPLLIKILDAQTRLSLQVHPPTSLAAKLGGEPKTEMWYIVATEPGADLFVGLKRSVTRSEFERRIQDGSVDQCFHRLAVQPGDAMFLPSGRVHAIGAGNVIFEIQQNSDTTYRVHDWNRLDAQGRPRELHIEASLASIDFEDFEPSLVSAAEASGAAGGRELAQTPLFSVVERVLNTGTSIGRTEGRPVVIGVVSGKISVESGGVRLDLAAGQFGLIPAVPAEFKLDCSCPVRLLWAVPG